MKVRQGFVSNSSSSSFVIKFNLEDVTYDKILEGVKSFPASGGGGERSEQYAKTIFNDIQSSINPSDDERDWDLYEPDDAFNLMDTLSQSIDWSTHVDQIESVMTRDEFELFQQKWGGMVLDLRLKCIEDMKNVLKGPNPDQRVVTIEYGDGDGDYFSFLEHSGIIGHLFPDTTRISNH